MLWICFCIAAHWDRLYKALELGTPFFNHQFAFNCKKKLKEYCIRLNSYLAPQCF